MGRCGLWQQWVVGFDDGGDWLRFWWDWRRCDNGGDRHGADRWVARLAWRRSVGGKIGGLGFDFAWVLSFDFAIDFDWMARLGFDFAQREWHRWWIGILLGLWRVWGYNGGCLEVVWLRGWLLCGESDKETKIRKERDIICLLFDCIIYIILMCCIVK